MKKLSLFLVLAMALTMFSLPVSAEGYTQAPFFGDDYGAVEDRLPENPRVVKEILDDYLTYENGNYGGTLRLVTSVVNWDADAFVGMNEALLTMESANSGVITPNIVESCEANEDNTEFTFKLRKGLKWSDGVPVTMEDFRFTIENYIFNSELTKVIAAYMRDGGSAAAEPFKFEVIDDWTMKIKFNSSYGGFIVHLSIAGWKGYTEFLKPAHYLKQFHKDYAEECHGSLDAYYEFIQPFADKLSLGDAKEESVWVDVFNQIDMTNWELTDPNDALTSTYFEGLIDANFPVLYSHVMESSVNGVTTWTRNPYYFKVDPAGQQLPYVDHITSTLVEDMEMVQFKYMAGDADFGRESATIDNITLYRQNEAKAGITAYVTSMHNNPTDVSINMTYGLNADGTVKSDDDSKAWQDVVGDVRFRKALELSIDAEEILDAVYKDFGEVNPNFECVYDIDQANALLDEMGCKDIDGDGFRETPSGYKLHWQIWNYAEANDIIPVCELLVEYWSEIGLNVSVYTTESTLLSDSQKANEIPMRVAWIHSTQLWHYKDWFCGSWDALWDAWVLNGGLSGELKADATYLEPSEDYKNFRITMDSLFTKTPEEAVNEVLPQLIKYMSENLYIIEPLINVQQCVIINSDIGNVPTGGVGISWNFAMEQFYFKHPEQH